MEKDRKIVIYKNSMLVIITAIITFMITSIGLYNYFIKTEEGNVEALVKYIELSDTTNNIAQRLQVVKKCLDENYIKEQDEEKMLESAIKGYVAGLEDEYTEYLTKYEYEDLLISVMGDYVGIGIYMYEDDEGNVTILAPMKESPAEEADIRPGDIIVKVNDEPCNEIDIDLVSSKIKGEEGTTVKLEILRDDKTLIKEITRRKVEIQDSSSEVLEGNIGYIKLLTFDEGCTEKIEEYLSQFEEKGIESVILDFRDNTGGVVTEAISTSELFIDRGNVIMRSYDKTNKETVKKSNNTNPKDMNIVVLVNEYSASATEIVAAALKDNNVATIVGTTTYGKGVMQEIIPLFEGGIKVTTEEFKTPNGDKINKVGIEPNVLIEDNIETEADEQLEKAIELLK